MVSSRSIKGQLKAIGHSFKLFGRSEIKELKNILHPTESIVQCVYGHYHGGSGLLVATNQRLLLVDKRPFYLNVESMPYEHVKDIDFEIQKLFATLYLHTGIKKLVFRSISDANLRFVSEYVIDKIKTSEKPVFSTAFPPKASIGKRPYLNPAWRPHHLTLVSKRRPSKF